MPARFNRNQQAPRGSKPDVAEGVTRWRLRGASSVKSAAIEMEIEKVGRMLGSIGYYTGVNKGERDSSYLEEGEVEVRMKRDQLEMIAFLADNGYWLNVDPCYDSLRSRRRFSKEEAEQTGTSSTVLTARL